MKGIEGSILSCNRENVHNSMIFFLFFFLWYLWSPHFLISFENVGKVKKVMDFGKFIMAERKIWKAFGFELYMLIFPLFLVMFALHSCTLHLVICCILCQVYSYL